MSVRIRAAFALRDGKLSLVTKELSGPNGIAFSPGEQFLYVGNWDDNRKVVMRYCLAADGSVTESKVFVDFTAEGTENAIDGIKVDTAGNVYISGPRGLWIVSPEGKPRGSSAAPSNRTTSPGAAKTAAPSTSARTPASIACG